MIWRNIPRWRRLLFWALRIKPSGYAWAPTFKNAWHGHTLRLFSEAHVYVNGHKLRESCEIPNKKAM